MADEAKSAAPASTEPIIVNLPVSKGQVKLRPFVTGYQRVAIRGVMLGNMNVTGKSGEEEGEVNFTAKAMLDATLEAMRHIVLEVGGDAHDAYDRVLQLHDDDFQAVYDKVSEIAKLSELAKKDKGSKTSTATS